MKIAVLTGAGASLCLGYPTMRGFLESLDQKDREYALWLGADTSLWDRTGAPGPECFDLEILLDRLTWMADLSGLAEKMPPQLKPGMKDAPPTPSGLAGYAFLNPDGPEAQQERVRSLRKRVADKIALAYSGNPSESIETLETVHGKLVQGLVTIAAGEPLDIFTTNYDPSIEFLQELDAEAFPVATGFVHDRVENVLRFDERSFTDKDVIRLYHLHGSFYWQEWGSDVISVPAFRASTPAKILLPGPQKNCEARKAPFKSLYRRLLNASRTADIVIAIGYSGRDEEITHRILLGAALDSGRRIIVAMPDKPSFGWTLVKESLGSRFVHFPEKFETLVNNETFWETVRAAPKKS